MLTQNLLKYHLEYKEGHLYWVVPTGNRIGVGDRFGTNNSGYIKGSLLGVTYREHRLIWFYHYSEWPDKILDHINRIKNDNRIENLRESDVRLNQWNRSDKRTSNYPGVHLSKSGKWLANIQHNRVKVHLGSFITEIEAYTAYLNAVRLINLKT